MFKALKALTCVCIIAWTVAGAYVAVQLWNKKIVAWPVDVGVGVPAFVIEALEPADPSP